MATKAFRIPVVKPPWTTSLPNFVPAAKASSKFSGF